MKNEYWFFPESEDSERIGPLVGGRQHSIIPDTPGARGRRARAVREMTMVSTKAARDNSFRAEIRQSLHCQQEKQSRAAAAVGSHHEKRQSLHCQQEKQSKAAAAVGGHHEKRPRLTS